MSVTESFGGALTGPLPRSTQAAKIAAIRERDRTAIAREIHDEVGQALTVLKYELAWAQRGALPAAEVALKLRELTQVVDQALASTRRIVTSLRPPILDQLGLAAAIEWQLEEVARHARLTCRLESEWDGLGFPEDFSIGIFRIVQESLTNIVRHANAATVTVNLRLAPTTITVEIADDGSGFEPDREHLRASMGMLGMKERALSLRGALVVDTQPGVGTTVRASFPRPADL